MNNYIEDLPLSVRAFNALKRNNITSLNELLKCDLNNMDKIGKKTKREIKDYINRYKEEEKRLNINEELSILNLRVCNIKNFDINTPIKKLPLPIDFIDYLDSKSISNIKDLFSEELKEDDKYYEKYIKFKSSILCLVNGEVDFKINKALYNYYLLLSLDIYSFKKDECISIKQLVEIENHLELLSFEERVNLKLILLKLSQLNISDVKEDFLSKLRLSDRVKNIIIKRQYLTLEELGKEYGVTRERIRQIEAKAARRASWLNNIYPIKIPSTNKIYNYIKCSDFEQLAIAIDQYTEKLFIDITGEGTYISSYMVNIVQNFIENKKDEIAEFGYAKSNLKIDASILKYIALYLGYDYYNGNIIIPMGKSEAVRYSMIKIGKPIRISNNEDIEQIIKIAKDLFDFEFTKGRGLTSLIERAGVRVASGTYSAYDICIPLDENEINKIVSFINSKGIVNSKYIFYEFNKMFEEHKIYNEATVYRYLKENLNNNFFFGGASSIISSDPNLCSWGDVVIRDIKATGLPIKKEELLLKYYLTDSICYSFSAYYDDIINWSKDELYLKSLLKINSNQVIELEKYIDEKKQLSFKRSIDHINSVDSNIISKNHIKNNDNLYYFLKTILSDDYIVDKENKMLYSTKADIDNKIEEITI